MLRKRPEGIRVEELRYEKFTSDGFDTPSGKLEFYSRRLEENNHLPVPFCDGLTDYPISFSDRKEGFPLIGISGARTNNFTHSQFRNIPSLKKREKEGFVDIHEADAVRLGVSEGELVSVETPKGRIVMKSRISDAVHEGSVRIAWGWGETARSQNLNDLTDDDIRDPVTASPSARSFMCRVSPV